MAFKVLLADDSVPAQNMGKKILTDAGYDVVTVSNGLEAMRKIPVIAPDIAILDIFMPGYTGLEVCKLLRANPVTAELPVILTVGKLEPYRPEDGEAVRSNAVIVKPFAADELASAVRSLIGARPAASESKAEAEELPPEAAAGPSPQAVAAPAHEDVHPPLQERVGAAAPLQAAEEPQGLESLVFNPDAGRSSFRAAAVEDLPADSFLPAEGGATGFTEFALGPHHLEPHDLEAQTSAGFAVDEPATGNLAAHEPVTHEPLKHDPVASAIESWQPMPLALPYVPASRISSAGDAEQDGSEVQVIYVEPPAVAPKAKEESPLDLPAIELLGEAPAEAPVDAAASAVATLSTADAEAPEAAIPEARLAETFIAQPWVAETVAETLVAEPIIPEAWIAEASTLGGIPEMVIPRDAAAIGDGAWTEEAVPQLLSNEPLSDELEPEVLTPEEEARRQAFEKLFNSDVPFPLEGEEVAFRAPASAWELEFAPVPADAPGQVAEREAEHEVCQSEPEPEIVQDDRPEPLVARSDGPVLVEELEPPKPAVESIYWTEPMEIYASAAGGCNGLLPQTESEAEAHVHTESPLTEYPVETPEILQLASAAVVAPTAYESAPERSELMAEVAKVEALLVQMQAVRQANSEVELVPSMTEFQQADAVQYPRHPLGVARFEEHEESVPGLRDAGLNDDAPEESVSGYAATDAAPAAGAGGYAATDAAPAAGAGQAGGEMEEIPAPLQLEQPNVAPEEIVPVEMAQPSVQPIIAQPMIGQSMEELQEEQPLAEAPREESSYGFTPALRLSEADRIHKAVETVFDRFRPLLVAAIVRELARLD